MMSPPAPQPNNKRYWGDEKNIDSIYSIYLKKICYTFNNDISLSAAHTDQLVESRTLQDDVRSSNSTSSNDLVRCAIQNSSGSSSKRSNNDSNCQKLEGSPRSRKNFFQKYRRRSCSVDKYSFEKQQAKFSTPNFKTNDMRITTTLKNSSHLDDLSNNHDDVDGLNDVKQNCHSNNSQQRSRYDGLQKSMNELSNQTSQSLQWETRQIKVLQAATIDHVLKFILLINSSKDLNNVDVDLNSPIDESVLEEERNNVAHIIHVLFCTYRIYTNPYELMLKLMDYSDLCRIEQYRFVMHYWMENYPEDFDYLVENPENSTHRDCTSSTHASVPSITSINNSITSFDSSNTTKTAATSDSENSAEPLDTSQSVSDSLGRRLSNLSIKMNEEKSGVPLIQELIRLSRDEYIRNKALKLSELRNNSRLFADSPRRSRHNQSGSRNSVVLDFDSRYVAQQLTAIDLENFLSLKPYSLLEGTKTDKRIQSMVKNFNLLSRHVVVTILNSHTPHVVTSHWISIAMNLRKIKNFNSLKAIIAGLTNESIYRLKQMVWSKIDRTSIANFKLMASIVDDVNNQTVLRQTQLIVEGTAKMSIEDDSFGTIPYLGTFLTDLNMIDARFQSYVPSPKDETSKLKLINFEKCAKQFEILTQVQLLQKNVLASLHAIQRRNHFDEQTTLNRLKLEFNQNHQMLLAKPAIPQVSRLFENWFYDSRVASMTDKQCYEISVTLEQNIITR